ncbi:hypothetical protein [Variovorax sp. CF313]|uniref:hypothetical protein n=1 Tax=Variovorax sp. CF313 TaxID=1144315 RepID=UPI00138B16E0|nr:hypothetical protein [Variovorax sp. CF313]
MYYLTVEKNGVRVIDRKSFEDYSTAIKACGEFYQSKTGRSNLEFNTDVVNGEFFRSYAELNRPEDISLENEMEKIRYSVAAKHSNRFEYEASLFFLIESDSGVAESEQDDD